MREQLAVIIGSRFPVGLHAGDQLTVGSSTADYERFKSLVTTVKARIDATQNNKADAGLGGGARSAGGIVPGAICFAITG